MRLSLISAATFAPMLLNAAMCSAKGLVYTPATRAKKILFLTFDNGGHFASYPGVWDGLARRGHDVTVAFPNEADPWFEKSRELYENQDLPNLNALHTGTSLVDKKQLNQEFEKVNDSGSFSTMLILYRYFQKVMEGQFPVLDKFLQENHVDVIVHDLVALAALPLCHKHNVPCVALSVFGNIDGGPMGAWRPPLGMGMHPASPSFLERLWLPLANTLAQKMSAALLLNTWYKVDQSLNNTVMTSELATAAVRRATSCPSFGMTLVTTPPGIDQAQIVDPTIAFVGPMRDMERYAPLQPESPELAFLDQAAQDQVPVVFMAAGVTAVIREHYIVERLELVRKLTKDGNVRVLWANKRGLTEEELASVPGASDAILVSKFVPQQAVLHHPAVKVFLTHGGSTSMMEGLSAGVPFLCQPYAFEQVQNCIDLEHRGAGVHVQKGAPVESFVEGVNTMLTDQTTYANQASKVWDHVTAFGEGDNAQGARRAVHLVENVANNGVDHLIPEVCSWPLYQQFHLDTLMFCVVLGGLGLWMYRQIKKQRSNTSPKFI